MRATASLYLYENVRDPAVPDADPWNWTAVDLRTGKVLWKRLRRLRRQLQQPLRGIALGRAPERPPTLYLGGVGGVMALRDGA